MAVGHVTEADDITDAKASRMRSRSSGRTCRPRLAAGGAA